LEERLYICGNLKVNLVGNKNSTIFAVLNYNLNFKIMGTRSLTTFIDKWTNEKTQKVKQIKIVTMYRQFDGYPKGMGIDLAEFLAKGKLVYGISSAETELVFNGMSCLAAQAVAHFKEGPGGIYLHRGGTINCDEEYRYEVIATEGSSEIIMRCYDVYKKKWIFQGTPTQFIEQIEGVEKLAE
jgi:hypothetical protein